MREEHDSAVRYATVVRPHSLDALRRVSTKVRQALRIETVVVEDTGRVSPIE